MDKNDKKDEEERLKEQLRKQTNDIFNLFGNNAGEKSNTQDSKEKDR